MPLAPLAQGPAAQAAVQEERVLARWRRRPALTRSSWTKRLRHGPGDHGAPYHGAPLAWTCPAAAPCTRVPPRRALTRKHPPNLSNTPLQYTSPIYLSNIPLQSVQALEPATLIPLALLRPGAKVRHHAACAWFAMVRGARCQERVCLRPASFPSRLLDTAAKLSKSLGAWLVASGYPRSASPR